MNSTPFAGPFRHASSDSAPVRRACTVGINAFRPFAASLLILVMLLTAAGSCENALSWLFSPDKVVGKGIDPASVTDFYYTYDASTAPPHYQRYRFYAEDGAHFFYHETREGGGWPQTEADITVSGTVALTDEQWEAFLELIRGGTASPRVESLDDGDAGPWLFIYWTGGESDGRAFSFESREKESGFCDLCASLKQ